MLIIADAPDRISCRKWIVRCCSLCFVGYYCERRADFCGKPAFDPPSWYVQYTVSRRDDAKELTVYTQYGRSSLRIVLASIHTFVSWPMMLAQQKRLHVRRVVGQSSVYSTVPQIHTYMLGRLSYGTVQFIQKIYRRRIP
jgi:hypothetical protein